MVLILSLLSFGEKVGVRLVCRKWKQAVDWMFGQQSSVRIVLRLNISLLMEDCGWKSEQMCEHTFDPGYDFCFTHHEFQHVFDLRSEDAKKRQVVDRFIGGIHFVMKYFHEASVIAAVCGYMETYFAKRKLHYYSEDINRLQVACGELAARFGSQAKCMTIPMLDIDHSHSFPELVHLTCRNISSDITNVFGTVTPKLKALSCEQMHTENYRNLPHGFRSICTFLANEERTDSLKLIQQSACRESIRRIRVSTGSMRDGSRDTSFPHLTSVTIVAGWGKFDKFPDYLSATTKGLQRLTLHNRCPTDKLPKRLDNLQSLVFYVHGSNHLIQMLGQTPQLQQLHVRLMDQFPDEAALLSALSLLPHLRFVDIRFSSYTSPIDSISPNSSAAIMTFLRGPLRPHLTFCRFAYGAMPTKRCKVQDHVQEVMAEMRFMTQTQKLVAGAVNNCFVRRGCPDAAGNRMRGLRFEFVSMVPWYELK